MQDCHITMKCNTFPRCEDEKQDERSFRSPVPGRHTNWIALIGVGTLALLLFSLPEAWLLPGRKHQRPLFRMPLTKAGHCLAGYHSFVPVEHGISVCQTCNLVCACPYCVADIPTGVPFVNCSYHQDAYLALQDAVLPTSAITMNGRRL